MHWLSPQQRSYLSQKRSFQLPFVALEKCLPAALGNDHGRSLLSPLDPRLSLHQVLEKRLSTPVLAWKNPSAI